MKLTYQLHIGKISIPNVVYNRRAYVSFSKFSNKNIFQKNISGPTSFDIILFFNAAPGADLSVSETCFLSLFLQTIEARVLLYPSYFEFLAVLNDLSRNNLSEFYLVHFDKYYHEPAVFFKFYYSLFPFSEWSTRIVCKSTLF